MANKQVFLDYGDLVVKHTFNEKTLARAHNLVLEYFERCNLSITPDFSALYLAHKEAITEYLAMRKGSHYEWSLTDISRKILKRLGLEDTGLPGSISNSTVKDIYRDND